MADNPKPLSVQMDTADDIPETYRELYAEQNGKWVLTGISGIKTQVDVDRVLEAKRKEVDAHNETKNKFRVWEGLNHEEVSAKLAEYDEMKIKLEGAGKLDEDKINQIVETRIKARISPVEKEKMGLAEQLKAASERIAAFENAERIRLIHEEVRKARIGAKAIDSAEEDILLNAERCFEVTEDGRVVTKDGVGVTPGITPDVWLTEMAPKRSHWWPESVGGGAKGSKGGGFAGNNPWSATGWNITAQGEFVRQHGEEKARQMAQAAGVTLGAVRPARAA